MLSIFRNEKLHITREENTKPKTEVENIHTNTYTGDKNTQTHTHTTVLIYGLYLPIKRYFERSKGLVTHDLLQLI